MGAYGETQVKGDVMKTQEHRGMSGLWGLGLAVLAGLALWGAVACRSEKPAPPMAKDMLSLAALTPVFGEAKDMNPGLDDFTQSDTEIILSYHLYLADWSNADAEIARDLAPKIRRLYGHFASVDRASFEVSLPDSASPGDWKPYVAFVLTRKIVKETGWSDLLDADLLAVAIDVKRAE
jgi:hypothetical protein